MKRYPLMITGFVWFLTLALPTLPALAVDLRDVVSDEDAAVDISGLWQERYILEITQSGNAVTAKFAQGSGIPAKNHSRCAEPGQVYFEGTLRGRTFIGRLTVCTPEECVEEIGLDPTKTTKIQFDVSEDCRTLNGGWLWEEYKYDREDGKMLWCRPSGFTEWLEDFSATRLLDCGAAKDQIKSMEQALALYKEYLGNITGPNSPWEVRDGKIYWRGTENLVAEDFDALQEKLLGAVQGSDEGASFGGEPKSYEIDEAVRGYIPDEVKQAYTEKYGREMPDDPCWCWDNCGTCADWPDPLQYQLCVAHEMDHCRTLLAKCYEVINRRPDLGAEVWNEFTADVAFHLQEEIKHYESSLETLQGELKAASHCN